MMCVCRNGDQPVGADLHEGAGQRSVGVVRLGNGERSIKWPLKTIRERAMSEDDFIEEAKIMM